MNTTSRLYIFSLIFIIGGIFFSFVSQTYAACTMVCTTKPGGGEKCVSQELTPTGKPECTTETFPGTADPGNSTDPNDPGTLNSAPSNVGANTVDTSPTKVTVTERVPGLKCLCDDPMSLNYQMNETCEGRLNERRYVCEVGKGLTAFQDMFQEIVRWVVYISMLLGVFAIAGAGILWTWGSDSEEYTKKAKGWVMNILIGLIILFSFRYILGFLAPWIFQ